MVVAEDLALGLLLGTALVLLAFTLVSYRRSGLRGLLVTSGGLIFTIALTSLMLYLGLYTDFFEGLDSWVPPLIGALVLAAVLVIGIFGGRRFEESP